jgi:hypothetical protein
VIACAQAVFVTGVLCDARSEVGATDSVSLEAFLKLSDKLVYAAFWRLHNTEAPPTVTRV